MASYRREFWDGFIYALKLGALWGGVAIVLGAFAAIVLGPIAKALYDRLS